MLKTKVKHDLGKENEPIKSTLRVLIFAGANFAKFAKLNTREIFSKKAFAKINSREMQFFLTRVKKKTS